MILYKNKKKCEVIFIIKCFNINVEVFNKTNKKYMSLVHQKNLFKFKNINIIILFSIL